jgi:uncharacterized protein YbjT (DUF2867 family)
MSTKLETILVTGATGNVGTEVIKQLSQDNSDINVRAAVHSAQNAKKLELNGIEVTQIDYNEPKSIRQALKKGDRLFFVPPESPDAVEHAANVIDEAKKSGIRHIVKLSADGADTESIVSSLRLHRQTEKIIEESGIPYTFLRPTEFMQNFVKWYGPTIRSERAFSLPAGNLRASFVDARDIAAVAVKALTEDRNNNRHDGKTYKITGPEILSYYQVAEILSNAIGKKVRYVSVPEEKFRKGMKDSGIGDWWIEVIMEVYELYKGGTQEQVTSAIEDVTGKKPTTFAQFAKDYADAFR